MSGHARRLLAVLALLASAWPLRADEFRPAYLQLTQLDATAFDVLWKVPALDESTVLKLRPAFPGGTEVVAPVRSVYARGAAVQRWRIRVVGGLTDRAVEFPELAAARTDVLVRLVRSDGTVQLERILPVRPRFVAKSSPGPFEVVRTYLVLGVEHILTGFDHLLFVLALMLLVRDTRRLVATVTAFTVAHSLTLAGATLGLVHMPGPPVEASIALSIVFVAVEILHAQQGHETVTQRYPWLVAFTFGLLHGFGFAGALAEVGLPQRAIPVALLCFNVGVEIGQLLFVVAVETGMALAARATRRVRLPRPAWLASIAPYAIGGLASFWVVERLAAF